MALTLRDVLNHPSLRPAKPILLSGERHLDHQVRWVHTADLYEIAPLLRGDEVLLTNGVGLVGENETRRRVYIQRLAERRVAGLFFEVGRTFADVPAEMVEEAQELGLPVVELKPVLRFTEVAEAVNSELIDASVLRLRHADETSRALSEALARGASLNDLVTQIGGLLGTWAQLQDHAARLIVGDEPEEEGHVAEVPVLVDGAAWGRLRVGSNGPAPVLVAAVLDRAPTVLGLCLIRERQEVAGTLRAQQLLLEQFIAHEPLDPALLQDRLRAVGVATSQHLFICIVVDPERAQDAARNLDALMAARGHGILGLVDGVLCAVLAVRQDATTSRLSSHVRASVREALPGASPMCAVVGRTLSAYTQIPQSMWEAAAMLRLGQRLHAREAVLGVQALSLENLLVGAGGGEELRAFVDTQIGPLLRVDSLKDSQLIKTLETLIESGGVKAVAAERLHLRRQSLYYRLQQISNLIETDLDDPAQLTTLAVALRAHQVLRSV